MRTINAQISRSKKSFGKDAGESSQDRAGNPISATLTSAGSITATLPAPSLEENLAAVAQPPAPPPTTTSFFNQYFPIKP
ncbi:hypothetical protein E2C01_000576 [Portunus trituberculatus]|uniref:Uncharacterized protein n=1 Tax=Portunus trituberculatus TaxID=210409 RepID=A0A5B7CFK1_PORTR|nr:hypothetical protein [Portunus trituberculatus]